MSMEQFSEEASAFGFGAVTWGPMPRFYNALQRALKDIRDCRTILIHDANVQPAAPLFLGAPGLRPHSTIALVPTPLLHSSNDTTPFGSGQLPDTGPNAREIHQNAWREFQNSYAVKHWDSVAEETYAEVGARWAPPKPAPNILMLLLDVLCALNIPDFDLPRNDNHPDLRYIGMTKYVRAARDMPPWWEDVLNAKAQGKRVVAVSRSSVDPSVENIILPAVKGLKDRDDVIVIVALVNCELEDFTYDMPHNVQMARFIPMDLLLPHVSLYLSEKSDLLL